jgi:hypothetical protein
MYLRGCVSDIYVVIFVVIQAKEGRAKACYTAENVGNTNSG